MIQRIQTLYLLLAAVFPVLLFVFPIYVIHFDPKGSWLPKGLDLSTKHYIDTPLVWVFTAISILTIFLYKNRKLQIRLCWVNALLLIVFQAILFYGVYFNSVIPSPGIGLFTPAAALIFTLLAVRAIKKDEALVRSADRIR